MNATPSDKILLLKEGEEARLISILGPDDIKNRLLEFGFLPGQTIRIVRKTAFAGPTIVEVNTTRVALRKKELLCLQV